MRNLVQQPWWNGAIQDQVALLQLDVLDAAVAKQLLLHVPVARRTATTVRCGGLSSKIAAVVVVRILFAVGTSLSVLRMLLLRLMVLPIQSGYGRVVDSRLLVEVSCGAISAS